MERALSQVASAAAEAGAAVIRHRAGRLGAVRTKSSGADLVTEVDVAAGVAVVESILGVLPEARFVVEEPEVHELTGAASGGLDDDEVWVVDPLDGTTSFVHGYPCYSVSVACLRGGEPVAGAVLNAATGELFSAEKGRGARLDGVRIRCSEVGEVERALIATGFPYERTVTLDRQLAVFSAVIRIAHDIRRDGSAAVDCSQTACGRVDAFWEYALKPWDMAAGVVILRESGAVVTDTSGMPWTPSADGIVAANPRLHERLLAMVAANGGA